MNWRLGTIAPDLVEQLEGESDQRLRRVTEAVVPTALTAASVDDDRSDRALAALRAGRYGDSEERAAMKTLTDELDEVAWDIQDRTGAGEADEVDYLAAFRRARAAMALWFALDDDPAVAAMESIYEARAATDDQAVRRDLDAVS
jgi:hypothetical protein